MLCYSNDARRIHCMMLRWWWFKLGSHCLCVWDSPSWHDDSTGLWLESVEEEEQEGEGRKERKKGVEKFNFYTCYARNHDWIEQEKLNSHEFSMTHWLASGGSWAIIMMISDGIWKVRGWWSILSDERVRENNSNQPERTSLWLKGVTGIQKLKVNMMIILTLSVIALDFMRSPFIHLLKSCESSSSIYI